MLYLLSQLAWHKLRDKAFKIGNDLFFEITAESCFMLFHSWGLGLVQAMLIAMIINILEGAKKKEMLKAY